MSTSEWIVAVVSILAAAWGAYTEWRVRTLQGKLNVETLQKTEAVNTLNVSRESDSALRTELSKDIGSTPTKP